MHWFEFRVSILSLFFTILPNDINVLIVVLVSLGVNSKLSLGLQLSMGRIPFVANLVLLERLTCKAHEIFLHLYQ